MRQALMDDDRLLSPAVGIWRPAVAPGGLVREGEVIGHLDRVGQWLPVTAPRGLSGSAVEVTTAGRWVQHGDALVRLGDGTGLALAMPEEGVSEDAPEGAIPVRTETDGTLYLRPEPGAPPFVEVGADVEAQATLALVEVMKTFTPLRAPMAGVVVRVDAADGSSVEAGQPVLWLRPSRS